MIVGTPWMIAISLAVNLGSVAVIVGRSPPARCNQSGHSLLFIAIRAADDCGSLHVIRTFGVIGAGAAVADFSTGRGKEPLSTFDAGYRGQGRGLGRGGILRR